MKSFSISGEDSGIQRRTKGKKSSTFPSNLLCGFCFSSYEKGEEREKRKIVDELCGKFSSLLSIYSE